MHANFHEILEWPGLFVHDFVSASFLRVDRSYLANTCVLSSDFSVIAPRHLEFATDLLFVFISASGLLVTITPSWYLSQ